MKFSGLGTGVWWLARRMAAWLCRKPPPAAPEGMKVAVVKELPTFSAAQPDKEEPGRFTVGEPMVDSLLLARPEFNPTFLILHHSLTKDGQVVDWKAIRKYHMDTNGWSDIGYHFGVERVMDGYRVVIGRPMMRPGAHTKEGRFNFRSLGVCLVGNFDEGPVPIEQWRLGLLLIKRLSMYLDVKNQNVIGHGEAQGLAGFPPAQRKSCPGHQFSMDAFRADLAKL